MTQAAFIRFPIKLPRRSWFHERGILGKSRRERSEGCASESRWLLIRTKWRRCVAVDLTRSAFPWFESYQAASASLYDQVWMTGWRFTSSMPAIMRSLSSCFEVTRMWRRTDRANLEKKPSMRLSHEPCLGVKVNSKRPGGRASSQALVSLDMCAE